MAKKTTTSDIALMANVSQSTVSKILSGNTVASFMDETVERVHDAATQLGYQPQKKRNGMPKCGNTKLIGVICPIVTNPYYAVIVQAVEQVAFRAGYRVFVCNTYRDISLEESYLTHLWEMGAEGIIYAFLPNAMAKATEINKLLPIVVVGDKIDDTSLDMLELDSYKSGAILAEYLLKLGHKNISFLSTTLNEFNPPRTRRLQGISETMQNHKLGKHLHVFSQNIPLHKELNYLSNEYDIGYSLTIQAIKEAPETTAIIGVNDMVAYGIVDALDQLNIRIPEDCSVCGFDDNFPSALGRIRLTTVDHHMVYKGNNAFDILLKKIQSKSDFIHEPERIVKVEYTPNLVIRATTGKPPKKMENKEND